MGLLEGKAALVTGAARGIGRAIAQRLAKEGARVAVNYAQSAAAAESLAANIGGIAIRADVSRKQEVIEMFERSAQAFGGLDIVVNNAGIALMKPLADFTDEEFERVFSINTRGAFYCCREAAHRLREGGRIVNISTGATVGGTAGGSVYCASKAAVEQFTRALARELAPRRITVNTVSPGFTETEMFASLPHLVDLAPKLTPLGRAGKPEEIAAVVAWLCTEDAGWITGQNIQAGGGLTMV
ncbi:MAG: SDR family oxidoreductase [Bryobacteraceae bacterium]|jgi:3-oxoacyl-[acyl-carrier protein] reductase